MIDHPIAAQSKGGLEILSVFSLLFLTVVLVIVSMSVANTMLKAINERVREVGTLRSLGLRRADIIAMFTAEGFILGMLSCFFGMMLTMMVSFLIYSSGITFKAGVLSSGIPLRIDLNFSAWITTTVFLCLVTTLCSWALSLKVAKRIIADCLRYVA